MDEARAWNYCLWLLGRRAHSRAELRERMARKDSSQETIQRVISRLEDYGFVDDEAFASQFVSSRSRRYGSLRLRGELLRKGLEEELVEQRIASLADSDQEDAALAQLERNAWRFTAGSDGRRNRARAWAFLARRGFPPDVVAAVIDRFSETHPFSSAEEAPES